ncbi:MAG: GNAT family N-acetyltransferase [Melioribacteraceae bacterium]|nr:GNAT family N-acetyltransferase [Melioribacteraceae bacterium]
MLLLENPNNWIEFINTNESSSIFHHPAWFSVLSKSYGLQLKIKSQLKGGIPFVVKKGLRKVKYISLPFSDYMGLLNPEKVNDAIISEIKKNYHNIEIEIRDKYEGNGFQNILFGYKHSLSLLLSEEEIFKSFKKTQVQQPIHKAIRNGLTASIRTDYESIIQFYNLHLLTRKKLGVPIQPKKFFYHLWKEIINEGLGFVVKVSMNQKVISSGIFAGFNKILTYKFSASEPDFIIYRPNNLMLWSGIQEAKKRGFEIFDFGRTDLKAEGLRKFKLGWGTTEEPLYYSYYPKAPENSNFKFVKNMIVAPIIKYSPKFVCRLSGELLYRYFG